MHILAGVDLLIMAWRRLVPGHLQMQAKCDALRCALENVQEVDDQRILLGIGHDLYLDTLPSQVQED